MKISTPHALRCALIVSAVSLCTALSAETSASSSSTTDRQAMATGESHLKRSDRHFFAKAAESEMKEVAVSQTTMDRFVNPQVKSFAQMMVNDHSEANQELMALAAKKGVMLPAKDKTMKLEEKWSKKTKDL